MVKGKTLGVILGVALLANLMGNGYFSGIYHTKTFEEESLLELCETGKITGCNIKKIKERIDNYKQQEKKYGKRALVFGYFID